MLGTLRLLKGFSVAALGGVLVLGIASTGNAGPQREAVPEAPRAPVVERGPSLEKAVDPGGVVRVNPAKLKVKNLALSPMTGAGVMDAGSNAKFGFNIQNVGTGKVLPGTTYSLNCTVLSGPNPCPLASSTGPIPELVPNASKSFVFIGVSGAKAGKYRVSVSTSLGSRGRPPHMDFTVPGLTLSPEMAKAPLKKDVAKKKGGFGAASQVQQAPLGYQDPDLHVFDPDDFEWLDIECSFAGPNEFPHVRLTNNSGKTLKKGYDFIIHNGGPSVLEKVDLTANLPSGQHLDMAPGNPPAKLKCDAAAKYFN